MKNNNANKRRKPKKPQPEEIGKYLRAEVSQSREESCQDAASRDVTLREKFDFVEVARSICPKFQIAEEMKPLLNNLVRWCLMLDGEYDPSKGLWLWGDIGTGKSTMLEIIREYCRIVRPPAHYRDTENPRDMRKKPWPYGFRISNMSYVTGAFAKDGYPGLDEYIVSIRQAFDEVGRECIPTGYYGNMENVFQYIIQRRYDLRKGDFTHVTSNLGPEQIGDTYGDHIYDRCIEMFNFVEMSGASWR